jgi:hypothetical protein
VWPFADPSLLAGLQTLLRDTLGASTSERSALVTGAYSSPAYPAKEGTTKLRGPVQVLGPYLSYLAACLVSTPQGTLPTGTSPAAPDEICKLLQRVGVPEGSMPHVASATERTNTNCGTWVPFGKGVWILLHKNTKGLPLTTPLPGGPVTNPTFIIVRGPGGVFALLTTCAKTGKDVTSRQLHLYASADPAVVEGAPAPAPDPQAVTAFNGLLHYFNRCVCGPCVYARACACMPSLTCGYARVVWCVSACAGSST